jgi:hemoglobin
MPHVTPDTAENHDTSEAQPVQTPYDALGGRPVIDRIANRFYDLVETDPQYAELRAMHAGDLTPIRRSLAGWLTAWAGGPHDWFVENRGKCMMSAHRGLGVSAQTARQWSDAMARAIAECGPTDTDAGRALGLMMAERLDMMANAMIPRTETADEVAAAE